VSTDAVQLVNCSKSIINSNNACRHSNNDYDADDEDDDGCEQLLVGSPGNSSTAAAADLASNSHSEIDQQYQASRGHNFSK